MEDGGRRMREAWEVFVKTPHLRRITVDFRSLCDKKARFAARRSIIKGKEQ